MTTALLGTISAVDSDGAMPSAPTFTDRIRCLGPSAYPTGGTTGFKAVFNKFTGDGRQPISVESQIIAYRAVYDYTNDKLMFMLESSGAEVSNNTDLSGVTFDLVVISK